MGTETEGGREVQRGVQALFISLPMCTLSVCCTQLDSLLLLLLKPFYFCNFPCVQDAAALPLASQPSGLGYPQ